MASSVINGIFERALIKYREELNAKEFRQVTTPTELPDVLRLAEEALNKRSSGTHPKKIKAFEALEKARLHLEPFDGILQGLAQLAPFGGNLIWGSVKTVFLFVEKSNEGFDEVFEFFTVMGKDIPLLDSLTTTFKDSALVKPVAEELVDAIMKFWIEAVKHYRARSGAALKRFLRPRAIAEKFKELKSELTRQGERLWRSAEAQHYSDTSGHQQQSLQQGPSAMLDWISAPFYIVDYNKACKKRYGDTCKWITRKDEYRTWSAKSAGALLVIYGKPGAGKTILSSFLVSEVVSFGRSGSSSTGSIVLYHYFKYNDDTKNTPMAAVRSMLEQLYNQSRLGTWANDLSTKFQNLVHRRCDSFEDWWEIFKSLIVSEKVAVTIVLDALDECMEAKTLAKELLKITNETAVKVVLTARKEGKYVELFAKSTSPLVMEISYADSDQDINSFVEYKIKKTERLSGQENKDLRDRLINKLCDPKSHQGMFLWAYLMCKDIKDRLVFSTSPEVIGKFPRGLGGIYERILDKLNQLPEMHRKFCRLILNWVVSSSRPLQFSELEHALKLSQRSSTDYFEKVEGGSYHICFSRKDIVRVCGSLVSYTGLADGDTVDLIHLSARDFLSRASEKGEVPVHLSSFGVNIPKSKALLCLTCLDFLLDRSLYADPYFKGRENLVHQPIALDNAFRERHPLYEYAVRYWPELAWDALNSQLETEDVVNVTHKIIAFAESDFSVFWTESFVSQYGPEFCIFSLKRFRRLSSLLSEALPWVTTILSTLQIYESSINHDPRVILNLMNTQTLARRNVNKVRKTQTLLQAGPSAHFPQHHTDLPVSLRGWVYYDVCTDSLYHAPESSERKKLDRWLIGEDLKFRPAVHTDTSDSGRFWYLYSAALSLCGQYITVTYGDFDVRFVPTCLQTLVWKIDPQPERTAAADWAELCLVDQHDIVPGDIFYNKVYHGRDVVSFGKKDTLNAPGSIWNIVSREKVSRPTAIYEPEASLAVSSTCFGMDRVARILHDTELDILDMDGKSLLRHGFDVHGDSTKLVTVKFSPSSRKLVVYHFKTSAEDVDDLHWEGLYCFLLDKEVLVKLQVPERIWTWSQNPQVHFTNDENKVVAGINDGAQYGVTPILVYALPNGIGSNGQYGVPGTCIFRTTAEDTTLCIHPPVTVDSPGLVLLTDHVGLQKRRLDQEWTETEERHLRDVEVANTTRWETHWYPIKQGTQWVSIHSPFVYGRGKGRPAGEFLLTVKTWRCGHELELEGTVTIELQFPSSEELFPPGYRNFVSCNGKYIATRYGLFQLNHDSLTLVDFHLAGKVHVICCDFSQDETRFAVTYFDKMSDKYVLSVFELSRDSTSRLLAKEPCQGEPYSVAFHPISSSFLIISSSNDHVGFIRIAKVSGTQSKWMEVWSGPLTSTFFNGSRFSSCGKYVTVKKHRLELDEDSRWPKFNAPQDAVSESGKANHPYIFVVGEICSPDMYRLYMDPDSRVVYFEHKFLDSPDDEYRIRVLCVLPEDIRCNFWLMLIWPPDDAEDDEVKLAESGKGLIVRTGIRSQDLLHGDEWIAAKDFKKKQRPDESGLPRTSFKD